MSRWQYFLRRLLLSIPVVIFGTTITFIVIRMGPIDPVSAIIGPEGDPRRAAQLEEQLGLNEPLWEQYIMFMTDLFTLDLGQSEVVQRNRRVADLVVGYAPRTIWLGFWSVLIAVFIGIPMGFYAGLHPNTWGDYTASFGGIVWRAMPNFWLAVMLTAILRRSERYFLGIDWLTIGVPVNVIGPPPLDFAELTGSTVVTVGGLTLFELPFGVHFEPWTLAAAIKQTIPPALVLGSAAMGNEMRIGRTAVLETINSNYVETAKAKGLPNRIIVWKHVFRNSLIPLVPVITNEVFLLLGGSVIVEVIFGINGIGYLFFQAAINGDLPVVGSLMFIFILLTVSVNIFQDFLYTVIDPRVGYER